MKKLLASVFLIFALASFGFAQTNPTVQYQQTLDGTTATFTIPSLTGLGINSHMLVWTLNGTNSACTIKLQSSVDNSTWVDVITGTCTSSTKSVITLGVSPFWRLNLSTFTPTSGGANVNVSYNGFVNAQVTGGSSFLPASVIASAFGDGVSATIAGPSNAAGNASITGTESYVYNGTTIDRIRSASLANDAVATTTSARNSIGAVLAEKGSRWTVVSTPGAGTQASASILNESGVRHVADCVSFSAGSTTAPALTRLTINLRDGNTGAGTIINSWTVVISAATGQNVAPFSLCGLNLPGTTNTSMTLEFSASLANLFEDVTLTGYNVN